MFDNCAQNSQRDEFCDTFAHRVLMSRRTVNQLRTQFVTIMHKTRGDMSFVTFLLIQLVTSR